MKWLSNIKQLSDLGYLRKYGIYAVVLVLILVVIQVSSSLTPRETAKEAAHKDQTISSISESQLITSSDDGTDDPIILQAKLTNDTNEGITSGVVTLPSSMTSQLTEAVPEPKLQVIEESSETHQNFVAVEIPEHTIEFQEAAVQKLAMLNRESLEGHDQTVPANDLQPQTLRIDSALILPEGLESDWSVTVSRRNDSLSSVADESVVSGVIMPPSSMTSQLTESVSEPVIQVIDESSESVQITVEVEIPQHTITNQEAAAQKIAMLDRESIEGQDQTMSANDLQPETLPIDSALILPEGLVSDWSAAESKRNDSLSSAADEGVVTPLSSVTSQLTESVPEPELRVTEESSESHQNVAASEMSEHTISDDVAVVLKVAMLDRGSFGWHNQTVPENELQLETSPIDYSLNLPEGLELDWSATVSKRNDSLSNGTGERVAIGVYAPSSSMTSQLTESVPEPVLHVAEKLSESHQNFVAGEIPEHTIANQEAAEQKVAMLDLEYLEEQDRTVPANDLQSETLPIDSALILPGGSESDWLAPESKRNDSLSNGTDESAAIDVVTPSRSIASQLTESLTEPVLEELSESHQNIVAGEMSEHAVTGQKVPEQKVAMLDRESVLRQEQTVPESDLQLETPPIDYSLILPESLELDWSTTVFKRNDTLSKVLQRNGIKLKTMYQLLDIPGTGMLKTVYPNDQLTIARGVGGELVGIEFRREKKGVLMFVFADGEIKLIESAVARKAGSLWNIFDKQHRVAMQEKQESFIQTVAAVKQQKLKWHELTVRRGDTLSQIFSRIGISGSLEVALAPSGNWLRSGLMPKQEIRIATHVDNTFAMIEVFDFKSERIRMVVADDEGYAVGYRKMQPEIREYQACATVTNNLYSAAKSVKIPVAAVDEYADIFASRIDFSRQLQKGDRFCMIYQRKFVKERIVGQVEIIAASLEQKDYKTQTFRVTDKIGDARYYDQYGESMLGHFLRAPVKSARVTSVFSNNRFHPVLKKYRKHQGVDYGAPKNTPIISTADGVVSRRSNNPSGYGKVIIIQHGSKYQTLYAHMSRFAKNTSQGSYVKRGQVIGYVGSSGQSTGNHVHYEFRVNGVHRDPQNYPMPKGKPVPENLREEFERKFATLSPRLQGIEQTKVVLVSSNLQE